MNKAGKGREIGDGMKTGGIGRRNERTIRAERRCTDFGIVRCFRRHEIMKERKVFLLEQVWCLKEAFRSILLYYR